MVSFVSMLAKSGAKSMAPDLKKEAKKQATQLLGCPKA